MEQRDAIMRMAQWAADECEVQRVGPLKVPMMIKAALLAEATEPPFTHTFISTLGRYVEPEKPQDPETGYRTVNVTIGGVIPLPEVEMVPKLMGYLLAGFKPFGAEAPNTVESYPSLYEQPVEFYRWFEEVHPFADGNGRVGSILYNKLLGTLEWPYEHLVRPPDLWSEENKKKVAVEAWRQLAVRGYGEEVEVREGLL